MPELPEVETLRRNLQASLVGRSFAGVDLRLPKLFVAPTGLRPDELVGRSVLGLRRRAKFLLFDLSDELALVCHLRLAGQLVHRDRAGTTLAEGGHPVPAFGAPLPHRSTHVIFHLDDGSTLYLTDIRQFGRVWFLPAEAVDPFLTRARLGPEPLDPEFTVAALAGRLARRPRAQLKPLLLDQSFVGGVGNIYADEIIFDAGLGPATRAEQIQDERLERLHRAMRAVLELAVREGVAEILNGKAAPGRDFPRVHGRAGQPCPRCGTTVVKTRFAGRGTYTCPTCQGKGEGGKGKGAGDSIRSPSPFPLPPSPTMPELPEVETTARGLRARVLGKRIVGAGGIDWPRMLPNTTPALVEAALPERAIESVERRGKYLLLGLSGDWWLVIHRKMSGNLVLRDGGSEPVRHTHLVLRFDDGGELHFVDPRKFGRIYLFDGRATLDAFLAERLGPEPLADLTPGRLAELMRGRRGRLKSLLLDQRFLAGIGNLYADEILWEARLHPERSVASLTSRELGRLAEAVAGVLAEAIDRRGTSFSDYVDATGEPGENQDYLRVYGRAGLPCRRCGRPVERRVLAQRGTWLCTRCQRPAPSPPGRGAYLSMRAKRVSLL